MIDYNHAVTSIISYLEKSELSYDKNKMIIFKATTLNQVIENYYTFNKTLKFEMYKKYKASFINTIELSLREVLCSKHTPRYYKKNILLWKTKLYHIYKN